MVVQHKEIWAMSQILAINNNRKFKHYHNQIKKQTDEFNRNPRYHQKVPNWSPTIIPDNGDEPALEDAWTHRIARSISPSYQGTDHCLRPSSEDPSPTALPSPLGICSLRRREPRAPRQAMRPRDRRRDRLQADPSSSVVSGSRGELIIWSGYDFTFWQNGGRFFLYRKKGGLERGKETFFFLFLFFREEFWFGGILWLRRVREWPPSKPKTQLFALMILDSSY